MNVIEQYEKYNEQFKSLHKQLDNLSKERIEWSKNNRVEIKKMFPKKNQIYKIINPLKAIDTYYYRLERLGVTNDKTYYFKPTYTKFNPNHQFDSMSKWDDDYPYVKGDLLDDHLKKIDNEIRVFVHYLQEANKDLKRNTQNKITKVYVMIDKNTGYYKIGRSVNPKQRERTLQSEKPTIEMLFNCDARVKDEKTLHDMFADKRVRGEWFDLSGSDLAKVQQYFK